MNGTYPYYRDIFRRRPMPFAFVDLDRFDRNVAAILRRAGQLPVCIASKSIRCVTLIKRIQAASDQFHAVMAYSAREAVFLCNQGFDNLLVAYPIMGEAASGPLCETIVSGKRITLMVDCIEQVDHLDALGRAGNTVIPICMDICAEISWVML